MTLAGRTVKPDQAPPPGQSLNRPASNRRGGAARQPPPRRTNRGATEGRRLIAAAPDMYEALASLENDDGSIPDAIWKLRNDALAKARGETDDERKNR